MEGIKDWVINIAAAAILMVIIDLLIPEGRIRKFVQLLAGFIIMFVIINPVLGMLGKGGNGLFGGLQDEFFLYESYRAADVNEQEQARQTLELYREMLISDIRSRLHTHKEVKKAEVDIVLNENTDSEKFGQIRKIYINLIFSKTGKKEDIFQPGTNDKIASEIGKEIQKVFLLDEKDILINISEN